MQLYIACMDEKSVPNRRAGGLARSNALTAEQKKEIGQRAAIARWAHEKGVPKATHEGSIKVQDGAKEIPCAVLLDGNDRPIRLLSERAVTKALGGKRGGSHWKRMKEKGGGADLPVYLSAANLKPFITSDLAEALKPVVYLPKQGAVAHGLRAESLPKVCNVFLRARDADALHPSQQRIAIEADLMMRGLAEVGIIALVDEATGYQKERAKDALAQILDQFISKELRPWTRTFPPEFYEQIFRLNGWRFDPSSLKRPGVIGHWTNDFVYSRLAPGVLEELQHKNPVVDGRRKNKNWQWLTGDIGDPRLRAHIEGIMKLMRGCATWEEFKVFANRFYPRLTLADLGFEVEDYSKEELEAMKPAPEPAKTIDFWE